MENKNKNKNLNNNKKNKINEKICVLDGVSICTNCGHCLMCDLDPNKICDNCGKCLDTFNTDEKGYVKINIDKVDTTGVKVEDFYRSIGLDEDEE